MPNATLVLDDKVVVVLDENPTTLIIAAPGPQGPSGDQGSAALGYRHIQNSASTIWTINHNLGKYPVVQVVDSSGSNVIGHIVYNNVNQITITFSAAFSGEAYLS